MQNSSKPSIIIPVHEQNLHTAELIAAIDKNTWMKAPGTPYGHTPDESHYYSLQ